jgi:large subunit ribosomal protein L9
MDNPIFNCEEIMEVILRQDIDRLGKSGDRIKVKEGYARNFLIPRGLAYEISPANLAVLAEEQKLSAIREQKMLRTYQDIAKAIERTSLTVKVLVGLEDKIFGSVTSQVIAELLAEKGIEVDRRKIQLDEPIKALGVYEVPIKLHTDIEAKVKVWVVK